MEADDIVFYDLVGKPITPGGITSSCSYKLQCDSVCGSGSRPTATPPGGGGTGNANAGPAGLGDGSAGLTVAVALLAVLGGLLTALLVGMVCCARRRGGRIPFLGGLGSGVGKARGGGGGGGSRRRGKSAVLVLVDCCF